MAKRAATSAADAAVERLRAGGLVAFPTETVWGLAAAATSREGLERLRVWKGRDARQPLSLLVSGASAVEALGFDLTSRGRALAAAHWPGPLTLVLAPASPSAPGAGEPTLLEVARHDAAVGFRCSPHPAAVALAQAAEGAGLGAVTATSLNHSGQPPAGTRSEAERLCALASTDERGLDRPWLPPGQPFDEDAWDAPPSSVLDLTSEPPQLLRRGSLDLPFSFAFASTASAEEPSASAKEETSR